jgi:hypothetical protein
VADKLKAAILNVRDDDGNSPAIPSSKNIITISREGSQYRVDYLTGSKKYRLPPWYQNFHQI